MADRLASMQLFLVGFSGVLTSEVPCLRIPQLWVLIPVHTTGF